MTDNLNMIAVSIPLSPTGDIEALSKWDRVGPDLLAALNEILSLCDSDSEIGIIAHTAIAQAKGA